MDFSKMISRITSDVRYMAISAILGVEAILQLLALLRSFGSNLSFLVLITNLLPLVAIACLLLHALAFHGDGSPIMMWGYAGLSILTSLLSRILPKFTAGVIGGDSFSTIAFFVGLLFYAFLLAAPILFKGQKSIVPMAVAGLFAAITLFMSFRSYMMYFGSFMGLESIRFFFNTLIDAGVIVSAGALATDW